MATKTLILLCLMALVQLNLGLPLPSEGDTGDMGTDEMDAEDQGDQEMDEQEEEEEEEEEEDRVSKEVQEEFIEYTPKSDIHPGDDD